jgi:hypothetical protein
MKRILLSLSFVAAVFLISSCSGLPNGSTCTTGCTSGNANLTVTILDTPPAGANFLNFNLPIIGISLTSATTGNAVNVFSPTTIPTFDLVRLQSDSALLGTFQIAPDTYNKMTITLGTPSTIFANTGSTAIGSCAPVAVCSFNGGTVGSVVVTLSPALNLGGGANVGMGIDFTLDNIVTTTSTGGIAFDFTQPNAITPIALPRVGQAAGTLDTVEDFMGVITANSSNSLTVVSKTRGTLTGTLSNTTTYTGLLSVNTVCGGSAPTASCLATGKTVSVDATIGLDGTVSITEVNFIDDPSVDEIEGVIYPTGTPGTFGMIVFDAVNASNNSALTNVGSGFTLAFTLDPSATFAVDTRNLGAVVSTGFSSQSDMFAGQQVMIRVQSTNTSGTTFNVVTNRLVLRYSRTSATVSSVGGNAFGIVPPNFFGLNGAPLVQTFPGVTVFDNITDISGLTAQDKVSIRALYLNPTTTSPSFLAAKVRKH